MILESQSKSGHLSYCTDAIGYYISKGRGAGHVGGVSNLAREPMLLPPSALTEGEHSECGYRV